MRKPLCFFVIYVAVGALSTALAQEKAPAEIWELLYDGKVVIRLDKARFTSGMRPLPWSVAVAPKKGVKPAPPGPEHLEFREDNSTTFKDGIVTFVPVAALQRLEYDHDKKSIQAMVAVAEGKEIVIVGTTKFGGINKFHFEGVAKSADATLPAGLFQVQDGLLKTPIRGVRLHVEGGAAKPAEKPQGRVAVIVSQDKDKSEHKVFGVTALYRVGTSQRLAPVLTFQKMGQLDIATMDSLRQLPPEKKGGLAHDYEVTLRDGSKQKLALLEKTTLDENQAAQLVGLVGQGTVGYKLFPPHTIASVRWETAEKK